MIESPHLHSLSTGLVSIEGKYCVSSDRAEQLGSAIQKSFDNLLTTSCSIKRKDNVVSMSSLFSTKKTKYKHAPVDCKTLFTRLIAVSGRLPTLESAFEYELTNEPLSLFQNGLLRKGNKAQLKTVILHDPVTVSSEEINSCGACIINGEALLHRIRWQKGTSFQNISLAYVKYVRKMCKVCKKITPIQECF